jgi:dihydrodipicolinate synthase/N-acetylneuraminate lyase
MKVKKTYNGLVVPSVTPLTENHKLDHKAVEKIFDHFFNFGAVPFILGTTGEASSLPADVKLDYIKLSAKLKQPGKLLYAGISSNCVAESVEMAKRCADEGVDAVVAHLPAYFNLTEHEIKNYFETLADLIPAPLIIYNIPATTHISIPVKLLEELSYHDNIVGTKDSERSEERLDQSLALWANRSDFSHFLGWAAKSAHALINGCDGLVPSTGNLCPDIYHEMIGAVERDDQQTAFMLQAHSDLLGDLYQSKRLLGGSLAALKSLMQSAGLCQPYMMPPLERVSQLDAAELQRTLHSIIAKENLNLPFYQ